MLSDTLRQRLELLNRQNLPASAPIEDRHVGAGRARAATGDDVPNVRRPIVLDTRDVGGLADNRHATREPAIAAVRGELAAVTDVLGELPGEAIETHAGEHWLVRRSMAAFWPAVDACFGRWRAASSDATLDESIPKLPSRNARRYAAEVASLAAAIPRNTLFLDLETCGLAGSMVFLVGLVRYDGAQLVLEQLLARNYAEEQAVLHTLWRAAAEGSLLVTFNGKSFDWPLVQDRSTYHRLGRGASEVSMVELPHVDLLHHARRRWRQRLPDCRLQTLERFLCGRHRSGDIPGREIPDAYHRYVATGRVDEMQAILHHNALDLVTLVQLATLLTTGDNVAEEAA